MKKLFCLFTIIVMLSALAACGSEKTQESAIGSIDVDLTKLSRTMVYSEVYNMMYTPDDYIGKTVKMKGQFAHYEDPDTKVQYFACIIADAEFLTCELRHKTASLTQCFFQNGEIFLHN